MDTLFLYNNLFLIIFKNQIALDMVISRIQRDLASRGAIVDGNWSPFRRPAEAEVEPKDEFKL